MTTNDLTLQRCPFCGGAARWCADREHECHLIVCDGCKLSIDFQENPDTETVRELQVIMASKWNRRVVPGVRMSEQREKELLDALKYLTRHYVGTLEHGRDRIIELGGTCDPVDVMERGDPHLRVVREVIEKHDRVADEPPAPALCAICDHIEELHTHPGVQSSNERCEHSQLYTYDSVGIQYRAPCPWCLQLELRRIIAERDADEPAAPPLCAICDHIEELHTHPGVTASHEFVPRAAAPPTPSPAAYIVVVREPGQRHEFATLPGYTLEPMQTFISETPLYRRPPPPVESQELRAARFAIGALIAAAGGRVVIMPSVLVKLDPHSEIETFDDPVSGARVFALRVPPTKSATTPVANPAADTRECAGSSDSGAINAGSTPAGGSSTPYVMKPSEEAVFDSVRRGHVVGAAQEPCAIQPDGYIRYSSWNPGGSDPEQVFTYEFASRDEAHEGDGWIPLYARASDAPVEPTCLLASARAVVEAVNRTHDPQGWFESLALLKSEVSRRVVQPPAEAGAGCLQGALEGILQLDIGRHSLTIAQDIARCALANYSTATKGAAQAAARALCSKCGGHQSTHNDTRACGHCGGTGYEPSA